LYVNYTTNSSLTCLCSSISDSSLPNKHLCYCAANADRCHPLWFSTKPRQMAWTLWDSKYKRQRAQVSTSI